jgi:hypothetical protein
MAELIEPYGGMNAGEQGTVDLLPDAEAEGCISFNSPSRGHGVHMYPRRLRIISSTTTPGVEPTEEETIKLTIEQAMKASHFAFLDGKFYNISLSLNQAANTALLPLVSNLTAQIKRVRDKARTDLAAEKAKIQAMIPMPEIALRHIKKGMQVRRDGTYLVYYLPFRYAPTKIVDKYDSSFLAELSAKHKKDLAGDAILQVVITQHGGLASSALYHTDYNQYFDHYHGGIENCLGSLGRDSDALTDMTPDKVLDLRDRYQASLVAITKGDILHSHPEGFPTFDALLTAAKVISTPEVSSWVVPLPCTVGSFVKVLPFAGIPQIIHGVIGKLITIKEDQLGRLGVEFCFANSALHSCNDYGRHHQCYWLKDNQVEPCPTATRRTSKASPTAEPIEVDEPPPWRVGDRVTISQEYVTLFNNSYPRTPIDTTIIYEVLHISADQQTASINITPSHLGWALSTRFLIRST